MFFVLLTLSAAHADETDRSVFVTNPRRELIVHGFRAPVTGLELRDGPLGFHLGVYPTILGDEGVTTFFSKVGLSLYRSRSTSEAAGTRGSTSPPRSSRV
jgi:hypothetical protein